MIGRGYDQGANLTSRFIKAPTPVSDVRGAQKTEGRTEPSDVRLTYAPHTKILTLPGGGLATWSRLVEVEVY